MPFRSPKLRTSSASRRTASGTLGFAQAQSHVRLASDCVPRTCAAQTTFPPKVIVPASSCRGANRPG